MDEAFKRRKRIHSLIEKGNFFQSFLLLNISLILRIELLVEFNKLCDIKFLMGINRADMMIKKNK